MNTTDKILIDTANKLGFDLLGALNLTVVRSIKVYHITEGIHTDDCENTLGWDTVWNKDLVKNMDGDKGLWQCPQCNCVRDRDSTDMISYEEYTERYL